MKTLYLIRHAKSDWAIDNIPDIDRPLNKRGYREAHIMSQRIKEKNFKPDLIITSPAIRAITTALVFCHTLEYNVALLMINKNLYNTSVKDYLKVVQTINNKHNNVLIFGHNPIITHCANALSDSFTGEMSTCSIAGIRTKAKEWSSFKGNSNDLIHFDFPKNHST